MKKRLFEILPEFLFVFAIACMAFLYGAYAYKADLFPVPQLKDLKADVYKLLYGRADIDAVLFPAPAPGQVDVEIAMPDRLDDGLILLVGVRADRRNFIRVIDREGTILHEWSPDWFEIWGDEGRFPEEERPEEQPGVILHGAALLDSGDVVANFEFFSTFRLNPCGDVVWKLDNFGHHSVHVDEDGAIWVAAEEFGGRSAMDRMSPNAPPFPYSIQKIAPDGSVIEIFEIFDIIRENGLIGLLHLGGRHNVVEEGRGDTLHLNDVKTFPSDLESEVFEPGDIMVSLRNINTVLVMDPATRRIKFQSTGKFLRQHDPDFIEGDRISVFDNRNLPPSDLSGAPASRIVEIDARTGAVGVAEEGSGDTGFYTDIMGKHQRLANGNILITASRQGRAFEVLPDGALAWSYYNRVDEARNGLLTEATLLPPEMDAEFFATVAADCD